MNSEVLKPSGCFQMYACKKGFFFAIGSKQKNWTQFLTVLL